MMDAYREDGQFVAAGDARQRFYDARGYGQPLEGNRIALAAVETAHLLMRGDLTAVRMDGETFEFEQFLQAVDSERFGERFLVYLDLRERGFYLSPAELLEDHNNESRTDFIVYPRGKGPENDVIAYRIRVVSERASITPAALGDHVLAVVDEESEVTYFEPDRIDPQGTTTYDLPTGIPSTLLADRAICWDPPEALHESAFYGQPLGASDMPTTAIQLSLVETAHLVANGTLQLDGGYDTVVNRGRAIEGERFDRRLQVYATLRERGIVPKTGFKFGADFRTYAGVTTVAELGHSDRLIAVLAPETTLTPRELSLHVRLAHGVRKELVYAWLDSQAVTFLAVHRVTP